MSKGDISEDIPFEESYLSKYGEVPEIDCQPMVFRPDTNKSKRPTHFLAIRINSPALWSHCEAIQEELKQINPNYGMMAVESSKLHITIAVMNLSSEQSRQRMLDETNHIKQIVDFFFDNSRPCSNPKKTCCRICVEGLRLLGDHVLYFGFRDDEYFDRLRCCVLNIRKHLFDCENPLSWTSHCTIAKMSAACYHFKSFKDYKKSKHLLQLVPEVVNRVNKALYGSEEPHTYGDYLVTEIELNQMKSNVSGYYVVESTIPIFYSNARLIVPSAFHPIQTFAPRRQDETFDKQELYGDLPQRSSANIQCPFCHLHFSSERQCKRHQRVHKEQEEEMANLVEQGEEMEIVAKDGSYLVPREEYEAITHYFPNTRHLEMRTIQLYTPSLVELWKNR